MAWGRRALFGETSGMTEAEKRARNRQRRMILTSATAMVAKLVQVATTFITVPLTLHYLGPERYGIWMVISAFVAMLSFTDLGIGNGVLNTVAAAYGRNDTDEIRQAIASGSAVLSAIAATLLSGFALAYPFVAWHRLFNVASPQAQAEANHAIAAFFLCFTIAIPANIIQRVQLGLQRGFLASGWQCAGSLLSLGFVLLVIHFHGGLFALVAALLGGQLCANILNNVIFYTLIRPDIAPRPRDVSHQAARRVMRTGLLFLLLQITTALIFSADTIIITQQLGAAAVPQYAIADRLFGVITMALSMAMTPLWPAYREALVRGDVGWIRATLRKSLIICIVGAGGVSAILCLFNHWIVELWVGKGMHIPLMVVIGFGLWKVIESIGSALGTFLNGAHIIKEQVFIASSTALAAIGLEIILVARFGIAGAVWGKMLAYICFAIIPYGILMPKIMNNIHKL